MKKRQAHQTVHMAWSSSVTCFQSTGMATGAAGGGTLPLLLDMGRHGGQLLQGTLTTSAGSHVQANTERLRKAVLPAPRVH